MEGLLKENMSGSKLMEFIENRAGKKPSPGSIYPLLNNMSEKNILSYTKEGTKKIYHLTQKGKKSITKLKKEKEEIFKRCNRITQELDKIDSEGFKCPDVDKKEIIRNSDLLGEFRKNIVELIFSPNFLESDFSTSVSLVAMWKNQGPKKPTRAVGEHATSL
ncbi:MAG: PadR family transcriptional regulator [Candidatus Nanoarchaeia archaeon]